MDDVEKLQELVTAILDKHVRGDSPEEIVDILTGWECIGIHNILREIDQLLKARWVATGSPNPEELK